jgi:RluA family pseudouridine synthase
MNTSIKLSSPTTREFWEIPVLFEDDRLLALNKPPLLLTSPDPQDPERPSLLRLLHAGIAQGKPWARERNLRYLLNLYRLDFETGGVLLLAKSKTVWSALAGQLGSEEPLRTYVALVRGTPREDRFCVDAKLAPHPARTGMMHVDPKRGRRSRTQFEVVERFESCTLIHCQPLTDRPHQLRVHLRRAGHPVLGDTLYGGPPLLLSTLKRSYRLKPGHTERPLIARPAVHLERLQLAQPVLETPLLITAPWPKELAVAVKYLRLYSSAGGESGESLPTESAANLSQGLTDGTTG